MTDDMRGTVRDDVATERKPTDRAAWERFKEEAKRRAYLITFEGRIEHLERVCQNTPGILPDRALDARPPEHSRARYAEDILRAIRSVRHYIARGDASYAASEALIVGALAAEAEARHSWPEMKAWRAVRAGQVKARATLEEQRRELLAAVCQVRALHPGKYESARAAATHLIDSAPWDPEPWGYDVDRADPESRERAIDALRKRIERAEKAATRTT